MSRAYRTVTIMQIGIMCRVKTMLSRWKVRVLKLKAKIWRGAGSQYFTNNLWPGCLQREESTEVGLRSGCQWPDLIPIRADQQICGFCRWSHDGSRARGDENEFIRSEGLTLIASQGAINTHPSLCLDSCSQSFESHESALESKITRDQQIDKLYNKGWQKIPADNQVSISRQVREGWGREPKECLVTGLWLLWS